MLAEHIERPKIDWPDWETRFAPPRYEVRPQPPAEVRRGPKPVEGCGEGNHRWRSHGEKQVKCAKCPRMMLRSLLPPGAVIKTAPRGHGRSTNPLPDQEMPKCSASSGGEHRWLSKGASHVRCSLCKMTAKRLTA